MKNKNSIFYHIKCNPLHRLGNVMSAFVTLFDSLVTILTLGMITTRLVMTFTMYRLDTKLYGNPKKVITDK